MFIDVGEDREQNGRPADPAPDDHAGSAGRARLIHARWSFQKAAFASSFGVGAAASVP
jgi:hypothetical protein